MGIGLNSVSSLIYPNAKMRPLKIHVPNPCSENWNKMLPTQQGRICTTCSTEVTDFTKFTNEELKAWLNKVGDKRVCGNFRKFQLEDFNRDQGAKRSWFSISSKLLVASCLTLFVDAKANVGMKPPQVQIVVQQHAFLAEDFSLTRQNMDSDSLITINGMVKAEDDNAPLYGVWVGVKGSDQHVVTDVNGKFSIQVAKARTVNLVFKSIGYDHWTEKIYLKKNTSLTVLMKMSEVLLGELVITRPSLLQKTWSSIKRAFK